MRKVPFEPRPPWGEGEDTSGRLLNRLRVAVPILPSRAQYHSRDREICALLDESLHDRLPGSLYRALRQVPRRNQSGCLDCLSLQVVHDRGMAILGLLPGAISIQLAIAHTTQDQSLK